MSRIFTYTMILVLISSGMAFAQASGQKTSAYCYESKISVASLDNGGNVYNEVTVSEGQKAENIVLNQPIDVVAMTADELAEGKQDLSTLSDVDKLAKIRQMLSELRNRLR